MVSLYKDPKGVKVFDKYETPSFKSQQQNTRKQEPTESTTGTIDSLRKRIQELESLLAANQTQVEVTLYLQPYGTMVNSDTPSIFYSPRDLPVPIYLVFDVLYGSPDKLPPSHHIDRPQLTRDGTRTKLKLNLSHQ